MFAWLKKVHGWCNKHEWIIFLLILVLILRLPSLIMPHYYGDEEIYFVMGRTWREGLPLYTAMFDHKPPLIYILAGMFPTMFGFRAILMLFMLLHTYLFWELAKKFWGATRPRLSYLSSFIFVILTSLPTLEGLTVNAELLMMVPVTGAALILWTAKTTEWRKYLVAGLLGGFAWLYKIPVLFDMVALGLFFLIFAKKSWGGSIRAIFSKSFLAYAIAFVAPLALTFAYYYLKGSGPDYLATVLTVNLGYVSSWSTSTYEFNPFKSGLVVRGMVVAVFTLGLYLLRKKLDKGLVFASLWSVYALFGALLSARPYPHYLQEIVPAAALFIPFVFVAEKVLAWIVVFAVAIAGIVTQIKINFWGYPTISVYKTYWEYVTKKIGWEEYLTRFDNAPRNYEIAQYLNERLVDDDEIYIWGTDPTVYNLTNRLPSGGKYIVSFHVRDLRMYDYTIEKLRESAPKYIIMMPGSGEFADLEAMIAEKYILVNSVEGAEIYMRL